MTPAAVHTLANTFAQQVADKVMADDRYAELMMELLPEMVSELTGLEEVDDVVEVSCAVMDALILKVWRV